MSLKNNLLISLKKVEKLAEASKLKRLFHNPKKYLEATSFRIFIYPFSKKGIARETITFFNKKMNLVLPSGTDIFLTGGKSHDSEIRLARFLINDLKEGDTFFDIGAHYGYFSLLASEIVGVDGKIFSFEASKNTFEITRKNTNSVNNIHLFNRAISDKKGEISFYEFPNLYSEYNTSDVAQFENSEWIQKYQPKKITVEAVSIDEFIVEKNTIPDIVKIDVEGAEYLVIQGADNTLKKNAPKIILEYLAPQRNNREHRKALLFLRDLNYTPCVITKEGSIEVCEEVEKYLAEKQIDSDNIVFVKKFNEK